MPKWRRRIYFYVFVLLFIGVIPFLLLYASGYRFGKNWTILETGGIYVSADVRGSEVWIDGTKAGEIGFLDSGIFLQNLSPGLHTVQIAKEDFSPWSKTFLVEKNLVAQGKAFLLPLSFDIKSVATSSRLELSSFFAKTGAFAPTSTESVAFLEKRPSYTEKGNIAVWNDGRAVYAEWLGEKLPPYFFCDSAKCRTVISIWKGDMKILRSDFYPGRNDAIILAVPSGIYAAEMDLRPVPSSGPVFLSDSKSELDFRITKNDTLYIRKGNEFFSVEF